MHYFISHIRERGLVKISLSNTSKNSYHTVYVIGSYHSNLVYLMSELYCKLLPPAVEFFRIHDDCNGIFIHKICRCSFNTENGQYLKSLLWVCTLVPGNSLDEKEWGCSPTFGVQTLNQSNRQQKPIWQPVTRNKNYRKQILLSTMESFLLLLEFQIAL